MSPEIYKAIYEKVLHIESKEPINLCCVCLQTIIGDDLRSVHDETEFILNSGTVMVEKLSQVLKIVIGESFSDVLNTICHKCEDSALSSYSFIISARESAEVLFKAIEHLEICFTDTPESILQKCKTMYVDINLNAEVPYMIKRYYDKKRNESLKDAFDRMVMITQVQKPTTNLLMSEDEDPLAEFGSDYNIELSSSARAELAEIHKPKGSKYLNCSDCNADFNSVEYFTKHKTAIMKCTSLQNHASEHNGPNNCPSANNHKLHNKEHHTPQQPEQCDNNTNAPEKITNLLKSEDKDVFAYLESDQVFELKATKQPEFEELENSLQQQENVLKQVAASQMLKRFKYFNCPDCNAGFNSPELYQRHKTTKKKCTSRNRGHYPCNQCNFSAVYKHQLRYHVQVKHLGMGVICEKCGKVLRSKDTLKTHQLSHSVDNRFECHVCGKKLRSELSLKNHIALHTGEKNYPCHICGERFRSAPNRRGHVFRRHVIKHPEQCDNNTPTKAPEKITNLAMSTGKDEIVLADIESDRVLELEATKKPKFEELENSLQQQENVLKQVAASQKPRGFKYFNCPDCNAGFNSPELYQRHRATKKKCTSRNRGYFPCNQCNFCAVYKHQLRYHVQVKHLGIGVICEKCGKVFRSKNTLKTHQLSHNVDNKFECHVCGKKLRSELSLKNHMALHTGEKNYPCHICGERFRSGPNRREHVFRRHMILKPVQCEICQKKFKYKGDYQTHKKKHFSKDGSLLVDKTSKNRKYPCEKCEFRAFNNKKLVQHMNSEHGVKYTS